MGEKYEKLDKIWISEYHRQTTRIPENIGEKEAGLPSYVVGALLLLGVVVLLKSRKK